MNSAAEIPQTDAKRATIKYWERRRRFYNAALVLPALLGYVSAGELSALVGDREHMGTVGVLVLFLIAALGANTCYSIVYSVEFFFPTLPDTSYWVRFGRSRLFFFGTFFAMFLALLGGRGIARAQYGGFQF